jgi:hypothetical protein
MKPITGYFFTKKGATKVFKEDVMIILREVIKLNPWTKNDGNAFSNCEGISKTPLTFDKNKFECVLLNV